MKDLILISAYCPDDKRENSLRKLVYHLESFKDRYDTMVVSHTPIPIDIQKKLDFFVYDKKNEILTDWDLLNQPWFMPGGERRILSSFLTKKNTQLAVWRLMIIGFGTAKNIGYSKVHHIEYDTILNEMSEFDENSILLNEYNSVIYMDRKKGVDEIMLGSFQSFFIPKMHPLLLKLDEDRIKELIRNSIVKSPEGMLLNFIKDSGNLYEKDTKVLEEKGNKFGSINSQNISENPWSLPYYDYQTNEVNFISWNTTNKDGLEYKIILNENKIVYVPKVQFGYWTIHNLGKLEEINYILTIENNKIRDKFNLSSEYEKEIFKKMSYRENS